MIRKSIGKSTLHRRLLRPLLGVGAAPLAHLDREVAHDLAGRDAERLALGDRAGEHANAARVDAARGSSRAPRRASGPCSAPGASAGPRLPSGSLTFVAARRSDCGKLRPASSVTTRRSIRSGQARSRSARWRFRIRELTRSDGRNQPSTAAPIAATRTSQRGEPGERASSQPDERQRRSPPRNCVPSSRSGVVVYIPAAISRDAVVVPAAAARSAAARPRAERAARCRRAAPRTPGAVVRPTPGGCRRSRTRRSARSSRSLAVAGRERPRDHDAPRRRGGRGRG